MNLQQQTLSKAFTCSGLGVHSGKTVHLKVNPASPNHGIKFTRTDLPDFPKIPAHFNNVVDTSLATVIGSGGCIVSTIEHLMAALSAFSIDNALVELDSYEVPVMDGSAKQYTELIRETGVVQQSGAKCFFVVKKPISLTDGQKSVTLSPAPNFSVSCEIEFPHPVIGKQTHEIKVSPESFEQDVAPARTFGFFQEVELMRRLGLGRGGSLDNAIVVGDEGVLNEGGLRFPDEFVRHKVLDCIGDFALLGLPILGHIEACRSGHAFHYAFVKKFFESKDSWETLTVRNIEDAARFRHVQDSRTQAMAV